MILWEATPISSSTQLFGERKDVFRKIERDWELLILRECKDPICFFSLGFSIISKGFKKKGGANFHLVFFFLISHLFHFVEIFQVNL